MSAARSVITIGNFDGVHVGHAALVRRAVEHAHRHTPPLRVVALSFDPHPTSVLRPDEPAPARLTEFTRRAEWLKGCGCNDVVRLTPTPELLKLGPREFVEKTVLHYRPAMFVEGPDFHFGHRRAGDVRVLAELGREMGFGVDVVEPIQVTLTDDLLVTASSTVTRWLLSQGRVRDASRVLGRAYELAGTVVRGDQRGRTIGFPTANLATELLVPADGVYAARAVLPGGAVRPAAVNIGTRPTFDGTGRRVEAHILDAPAGEVPDGYHWALRLEMVGWLRDQVRFDSVERLVSQLRRDCDRARGDRLLRSVPA